MIIGFHLASEKVWKCVRTKTICGYWKTFSNVFISVSGK